MKTENTREAITKTADAKTASGKTTATRSPSPVPVAEEPARLQTFVEALQAVEEARAELKPETDARTFTELRRAIREAKTPAERERAERAYLEADEADTAALLYNSDVKIKIQLLKHNAQIALYNEVAPAVVEILQKYNGKPYGEKTREKIREELKQKTNCFVLFKSEEFTATPYNKNGFTCYDYEITIYTLYNPAENSRPAFITKNNKINALPLDAFKMYFDRGGAFDIPEAIEETKRLFNEARAAWETWQAAAQAFNRYAVGAIKELNARDGARYHLL